MTRILVIDDEPINHQLVSRALMPLQCELHYADNGKGGITQARAVKPDLIISDVMMPDISGYEVTRILRREPQFAATPILILTAQSGLQDKLKSFESCADDHEIVGVRHRFLGVGVFRGRRVRGPAAGAAGPRSPP